MICFRLVDQSSSGNIKGCCFKVAPSVIGKRGISAFSGAGSDIILCYNRLGVRNWAKLDTKAIV